MLRTLAVSAAVLIAFGAAARADDAADRHAASIELLHQMHTTDNTTQLASSLVAQVKAVVTRGDPDLMKQFDTFAPHLQAEV